MFLVTIIAVSCEPDHQDIGDFLARNIVIAIFLLFGVLRYTNHSWNYCFFHSCLIIMLTTYDMYCTLHCYIFSPVSDSDAYQGPTAGKRCQRCDQTESRKWFQCHGWVVGHALLLPHIDENQGMSHSVSERFAKQNVFQAKTRTNVEYPETKKCFTTGKRSSGCQHKWAAFHLRSYIFRAHGRV